MRPLSLSLPLPLPLPLMLARLLSLPPPLRRPLSRALSQPSVVTAPSTPPVLETGDYGGGWSTGFGVFFVTASRQVGALLSTSLFGVRRIVVRTGGIVLSSHPPMCFPD